MHIECHIIKNQVKNVQVFTSKAMQLMIAFSRFLHLKQKRTTKTNEYKIPMRFTNEKQIQTKSLVQCTESGQETKNLITSTMKEMNN